ncbi:MAG TPA: hypothetical protein VEF89_25975 [Solirubrobacteraceae bacterium]|nr:hypothetical protein [Solirubrobacteraceae bacterium]
MSSLWIAMAVPAGCGSTGAPSGTVTNPPGEPNLALQYAQCMRANGLPTFPDPGPNGIQFPLGSPILRSPAFRRAQKACQKYVNDGSR